MALVLILLVGLALRLYPLSKSGNILIGADGYYHLETVKRILLDGVIPKTDVLSYGGREHIYAPGFHLLASAFTLLSDYPVYRVVMYFPLLFYVFSLLVCYLYSEKRGTDGLLACLFLATLPVYVWRTTSNFIPEALWGFLVFSIILSFSFSRILVGLIAAFALAATHSIALIVLPILAIFNRKNPKVTLSLMVAIFFAASFWTSVESVYQNVPMEMRGDIFEGFDPVKYVSRSGPQGAIAMLALPTSEFFMAVWFGVYLVFVLAQVFELDRAIGVSALFISEMAARVSSGLGTLAKFALAFLVVYWAFLRLSNISWGYVPNDVHSALMWSRENTPPSATLASLLEDSYWVEGIAGRKNIMDGHFAGIKDVDTRWQDTKSLFKSDTGEEKFMEILGRYDAKYVLETMSAKYIYGFLGYSFPGIKTLFDSEGAKIHGVL